MPRISFFYGISIYMYYRDHSPPHCHAIYGNDEATIDIRTGELMDGKLPRRALSIVCEWTTLHRDVLLRNWELARSSEPLLQIDPLN